MASTAKISKQDRVKFNTIFPSPENDEIYGAIDPKDIDLVNLANDIAVNGIREPLQVSADDYIISGHRRYAAGKLVKLRSVPIVRLPFERSEHSELEWKRILRAHNHQRVKSSHVRLKETLLDIDPELAYEQLIEQREMRDQDAPPELLISGKKTRSGISDRKQEMLNACLKVVNDLRPFWPLSDRQVHYGLLNISPMRNTSKGSQRARYENDPKSYNDLCDMLTRARLIGLIPWEAIADVTRPVTGLRYSMDVSGFVDLATYNFLRGYRRDLLQSQSDHVELIAEKLTVQNIVATVANRYTVPMTVGRGYCSINPRYEIVQRYLRSDKDRLILLIASDFDPDGDEIAESFVRSIRDDFNIEDVTASKILLRQDQIKEWKLPPNELEAKASSSKFAKFVKRYGSKQVFELEAVEPELMQSTIAKAIEGTIDLAKFNAELDREKQDAAQLQAMKSTAVKAFSDMLGNGGTE